MLIVVTFAKGLGVGFYLYSPIIFHLDTWDGKSPVSQDIRMEWESTYSRRNGGVFI